MPFVKGKIFQNKNNKNKKAVGSKTTNCFLVEVAGLGSRRAARLFVAFAYHFQGPQLKKYKKRNHSKNCGFFFGRSSGTRTHGLLVPNQARYQTALYPEIVQIPIYKDWDLMAARLGFEPRQTESESVVLPLHNRAMYCVLLSCVVVDNVYYYTRFFENVNSLFAIFSNFFSKNIFPVFKRFFLEYFLKKV